MNIGMKLRATSFCSKYFVMSLKKKGSAEIGLKRKLRHGKDHSQGSNSNQYYIALAGLCISTLKEILFPLR